MDTTIRNCAVLHKSGKILYSRNYQGEPLDRNIVIGFVSSLPNLTRSLIHDELHQVMGVKYRVILRTSHQYIFLAHVSNTTSSELIDNVLLDLIAVLQLIFGDPVAWSHDKSDFSGCQDMIDMLCTRGISDPCVALRGVQRALIQHEARVRLDKLLVYLESMEGICNNATMLLMGDAVILSRFEQEPTRQIINLHKSRPLITQITSYTPIHMNTSWFGLLRTQLANYTLVLLYQLDRGVNERSPSLLEDMHPPTTPSAQPKPPPAAILPKILSKLKEFQTIFMHARIELPTELKPTLIRQFAKRETLLLMHVHAGTVTYPTPRPIPDFQIKDVYSTFWHLFGVAKSAFVAGVSQVTLTHNAYRFYAVRQDPDVQLYVLMAEADGADSDAHVHEILSNLMQHAGA